MRLRTRHTAGVVAAAALALVLPLAAPTRAATPASSDVTSAAEARRVDAFPTPRIGWSPCYDTAECATVQLPLDYDRPDGPTTGVAAVRLRARDQAHRIGSLFVNPGGPGGSATGFALRAPEFLSPQLLDRFDIVGMDPRGVAASDQVRCFETLREQGRVLRALYGPGFPLRPAQEQDAVGAAKAFGRACNTTGRPLSAAMSTATVARDMDVLRRGVGDRRLTYLGFSYGTYLGQVYANLFPDRVRALTIDGVLDPVAWAGRPDTADVPSTERLRSAEGSYKALHEILVRCRRAGVALCPLAAGDPVADYDLVARRLRAHDLTFVDPVNGPITYTYQDLVASTLSALYSPEGYRYIVAAVAQLLVLTAPTASQAAPVVAQTQHAFAELVRSQAAAARYGPYENGSETFASVLCSDTLNPANAAAWPAAADRADRAAPYFGRLWTWASAPCARDSWKALDDDAYRGPFTARTSAPVLVVGNLWDPATNYQGAVTAARLLPNSRLVSSSSWGHTAYGTSACVTGTVDAYLLGTVMPPARTRCLGDVQPFTSPPPAPGAALTAPRSGLPPVVPPLPAR